MRPRPSDLLILKWNGPTFTVSLTLLLVQNLTMGVTLVSAVRSVLAPPTQDNESHSPQTPGGAGPAAAKAR
jgi:hypothetical protein